MRIFSIGSTKEGLKIPKAMFIFRWNKYHPKYGTADFPNVIRYINIGFISPFWTTEGRYRKAWYWNVRITPMGDVRIGEDEWKQ